MATVISRASWYTPLVDDSGSGTNGTVIAKAFFGALADSIDAFFTGSSFKFSSNFGLARDTSDGSDNGQISINGGGAVLDFSRGGSFLASGNEASGPGYVEAYTGNVTGSKFRVVVANGGLSALEVTGADGSGTFTSSAAALRSWIFNNTSTNGGSIWVERSGTDIGGMGPGISAGSNVDLEVFASAKLFLTASGGQVLSTTVKNDTTASAANVVIDSTTGRLQRSTSSARYKTNITPMDDADWRWLLDVRPVTFSPKESPDGRRYGGLLAEDVAQAGPRAHGVPLYAGLDADGQPDDVAYGHLVAPIIRALQALAMRLDRLEAR